MQLNVSGLSTFYSDLYYDRSIDFFFGTRGDYGWLGTVIIMCGCKNNIPRN